MQIVEKPKQIDELKMENPNPKKYQHKEKFTSVLREQQKSVYTEERAVRYVEKERAQHKEAEKHAALMAKLDAEYQDYLRKKDESSTIRKTGFTSPEGHQHSS